MVMNFEEEEDVSKLKAGGNHIFDLEQEGWEEDPILPKEWLFRMKEGGEEKVE